MESPSGYVGDGMKVSENTFFERAHHDFAGWEDGAGNAWPVGGSYTLQGRIDGMNPNVLYARWTEHQKVTLTYDANGGTGTMPGYTGYAGDQVTLGESAFDHAGYGFTGWNTWPDGSGDACQPGDRLTLPEGQTVLYAQWQVVEVLIPIEDADLPQTGDSSHMGLWCLLAAAAAAALAPVRCAGRKR